MELLFKYGADLTLQPISIHEILSLAIEGFGSDAIKLLLDNYPYDLHFERTGDRLLLNALESGESEIIRLIVEKTSLEVRPQLLAQAICMADDCTLETLKLCCEYGLDLNFVRKLQYEKTTRTLIESMLLMLNFECVDYMLQQGCDINITKIRIDSPALNLVFKPDLMMRFLPRVENAQIREKFINTLLFKIVCEVKFNPLLSFENKDASVSFLIENGASPFFRWPDSDYTFHLAATANDLLILDLFLKKYPFSNFFIKGIEGKTPIGKAAENEETDAFYMLTSRLNSWEKEQIMTDEFRQACEEFNLIAMRNIEQIIDPGTRTSVMFSAFNDALKANDLEIFQKLVSWPDDQRINSLLEMTLRNGVQPYHMSASMQLCLSSNWLRNHGFEPLPMFSLQHRPEHILEHIGRLNGKDGADFRTAVYNLCQSTALCLPIGHDILALHEALRYMQPALVSLPEIPPEIQEQFGRFIVHALPGMAARNAYLSDDYKTIQNIWMGIGRSMSKTIVAQLNALNIAAEQAQVKFRKSLRKDLPRICSSCIAPETGLLQLDKLEKKLQKFGLFKQNALRVIAVLQLAYAALANDGTVSSQSSNLQETSWRVQERFKHQLTEKFTECLAAVLNLESDRVDVSLAASSAQTEFSRAIRSLNEPDYMQAQGRTSIDNAFSAMVGESFFALLWWQMDQVCQAFDLRLPGEEKWQSQKLKPFLAFQEGLEKIEIFTSA